MLIDHAALIVRHIVVFQQLFAGIEIVLLDAPLRALDLPRQHAALDGFARLHADPGHERFHARRIAEDAHQIVFEREVEAARAGIALTPGATTQLVVDAPRFMAFGSDDVQTAGRQHFLVPRTPVVVDLLEFAFVGRADGVDLGLRTAAEHDVGATPRHVGGDRYRAPPAGFGDDMRLALVLLRVQHLVRDLGG